MPPRSLTTNQTLLPAIRPGISTEYLAELPTYSVVQWTFGTGSVIWKIWPACLLHILFAAAIVSLNHFTNLDIAIPNVLLTVLGVVIGFVISYRCSSGYDRYWMGRTAWTEIIKTSRTMSRLIHHHVPPRLTPKTEEEIRTGEVKRTKDELLKASKEKKMALDLIQGFAYATKHHLRGELGIYYQDVYDLIKPLHDPDDEDSSSSESDSDSIASSTALSPHRIAEIPRPPHSARSSRSSIRKHLSRNSIQRHSPEASTSQLPRDDLAPSRVPTIKVHHKKLHKQRSSIRQHSTGERQPLLPGQLPRSKTLIVENKSTSPQLDLMPFGSFFSKIVNLFKWIGSGRRSEMLVQDDLIKRKKSKRNWGGAVFPKVGVPKGAPRTNGTGEILPLEILRCLSEWCAVLEERETVSGSSLSSIMGCIAAFEGGLTQLEAILTSPLPFGYAVHIRHTVWIYLFFLPFQIVRQYEWITVVAVGITSFIYLGFLAAGEEIEQPFGYDENDLDLDLFCREIIADEIEVLKKTAGVNVYQPHHHRTKREERRSQTLVDVRDVGIDFSEHGMSKTSLHDGIVGTIEHTVSGRRETIE